MNEIEGTWPIMVRLKPAQPTMADWARSVDAYLKQKAALDRQRAEQATTKKCVVMWRFVAKKEHPTTTVGIEPA